MCEVIRFMAGESPLDCIFLIQNTAIMGLRTTGMSNPRKW